MDTGRRCCTLEEEHRTWTTVPLDQGSRIGDTQMMHGFDTKNATTFPLTVQQFQVYLKKNFVLKSKKVSVRNHRRLEVKVDGLKKQRAIKRKRQL